MPVWDRERGGGRTRERACRLCVCMWRRGVGVRRGIRGRKRPADLKVTNGKLPCLAFVRPFSFRGERKKRRKRREGWELPRPPSPLSYFPSSLSHSPSLFLILFQSLFLIFLWFPVRLRNHTGILRALN